MVGLVLSLALAANSALEIDVGSGVGGVARRFKVWRDNERFRNQVVEGAVERLGLEG